MYRVGYAKQYCCQNWCLIKKFDIFTFVETWLTIFDDINFNGYDRITNKNAKRGSGGVCTLAKKNILSGLSKCTSNIQDCLWFKLHKDFFK